MQSWIVLPLSIGLAVLTWMVFTPHKRAPYKELCYVNIGHVSFSKAGYKDQAAYNCKYNFDVQIGVDSGKTQLINEIAAKKDKIVLIIDSIAKVNCTQKELEKYINENCIQFINKSLDSGKIKEIDLSNLSSTVNEMPDTMGTH